MRSGPLPVACDSGDHGDSEWFELLLAAGQSLLPDLDVQPLDLLVERGKRNVKTLGSLGLVPVALLQHFYNQTALVVFHYLEQGRVRVMFEHRSGRASAHQVVGKQVNSDG